MYQCGQCKNTLINSNEELKDRNELLILNKIYPSAYAPKLLAPSEALLNLVDASLNIFRECFEEMKHKNNLRFNMYIKQNYVESGLCEDHEKYIIHHLLLVKIHDYCKSHKKNVMENKINSKLRIIKNM